MGGRMRFPVRAVGVLAVAALIGGVLVSPAAADDAAAETPLGSSGPSAPLERLLPNDDDETGAPAGAGAEASAEAPSTITVEGKLAVIPAELAPVTVVVGEALPEPEIVHEGSVSLATDAGSIIELFAGEDHDYRSGQLAEVTFAVPEPVQQQVESLLEEQPVEETLQEAEFVEIVVETAERLRELLEPLSHDVAPNVTTRAAAAPKNHTLDVIYLERPGMSRPSQAQITAMVNRLSDYWKTESNGQIPRITASSIKVTNYPYIRQGGVDYCRYNNDLWNWAAGQFNRTPYSYFSTQSTTTPRHLMVFESQNACGDQAGFGEATLSNGIHDGGWIWGTVDTARPLTWDGVMFHEFGHNLSLDHSNQLECGAGHFDTPTFSPLRNRCQVEEYGDFIDVMGHGYSVTDFSGNILATNASDVSALNTSHRVKLDALSGSAIRRLSSSGSTTVPLRPSTDTSGVRAIELTDPSTKQKYLIEYRAGKGRDAKSFYMQWAAEGQGNEFSPGVRVLRLADRGNYRNSSVQLFRPATEQELAAEGASQSFGPAGSRSQLVPGTWFVSDSGKLLVEYLSDSSGAAQVRVTLGDSVRVPSGPRLMDVWPGVPFYSEITWMASEGITTGSKASNGTMLFRPKDSVTREAMAAFLFRLNAPQDYQAPAGASPFVDVPRSHNFYKQIRWAYDQGITTGIRDGNRLRFNPKSPITREAMAAFMYRVYKNELTETGGSRTFTDVSRSHPFYTHISWMAANGITTGSRQPNGSYQFRPKAQTTREATAAFLYRAVRPDTD